MRSASARAASRRVPTSVKATLAAVALAIPLWWLADRHDRVTNQDRMAAIASDIAGRPVNVRCPGLLWRTIGYDMWAGSVRVDAEGHPANDTRLSKQTCAEIDAIAEGRRKTQLACAARSSSCGDDVLAVAWAVDTLTHESIHLRGIVDEGETECISVQLMAGTAQRLGATPDQAQNLAALMFAAGFPEMPDQYREPDCADGRPRDLRPADPVWP
jgi:hypothetical protein